LGSSDRGTRDSNVLHRGRRFLSGNPARRGRLLCGANFRTVQTRRHLGGCRLGERALAHSNFGDRFINRRILIVFRICRVSADIAAGFIRWRFSCGGTQVAIRAAQVCAFVVQVSAFVVIVFARASTLVLKPVRFRSPLFVVGWTQPLPPGVAAPAMFLAITDAHALRRKIFRVAGGWPRIGDARGHRRVPLAREPPSPFIC